MNLSLTPEDAWKPLPATEWDEAAVRHLLRRAGWTAVKAEIDQSLNDGLVATLDRLFPTSPAPWVAPARLERFDAAASDRMKKIADAAGPDKLLLRRELQEQARTTVNDLGIRWLEQANRPSTSALAKWALFLSDVYVVSFEKVKNPEFIFKHFEIISQFSLGPAPALSKAVSRSPAMINYLDLNQNKPEAPNENFARELFELFLLGEGNYSEKDIKEAARAFTGYRALPPDGTFRFGRFQHDSGVKTIFGQTGPFDGDQVIDLAYAQPAAASFLPHEAVKFYLSDTPLPSEYLASLGRSWKDSAFNLRTLAHQFFGSRLFFAPEFRGNFIKSPIQYYLGLLQDLNLDVTPLPRYSLLPLRQMGQTLFAPPNVRGWVGGRNWVNSATLAARRQFAEVLFTPLREEALNADERVELDAARAAGQGRFIVTDQQFAPFLAMKPEELVKYFAHHLLSTAPAANFAAKAAHYLEEPTDALPQPRRVRTLVVSLLESPEYQLC